MSTNSLKQLAALVRIASMMAKEKAPTMAANDVIGVAAILPIWKEGAHTAGSVVQYDGQPWRCLQAHDSTGNPDWKPGAAHSLWGAYHATTKTHALPWVAPTGAHDAYNSGEYMIWTDGCVYLCNMNATVHTPDVLPTAWEFVAEPVQPEPDEEPTEEPEEETTEDDVFIEESDEAMLLPDNDGTE